MGSQSHKGVHKTIEGGTCPFLSWSLFVEMDPLYAVFFACMCVERQEGLNREPMGWLGSLVAKPMSPPSVTFPVFFSS